MLIWDGIRTVDLKYIKQPLYLLFRHFDVPQIRLPIHNNRI